MGDIEIFPWLSHPDELQGSHILQYFLNQRSITLTFNPFSQVLWLYFESQLISLTLWMGRECGNTSPWCTKYNTLLRHLEKWPMMIYTRMMEVWHLRHFITSFVTLLRHFATIATLKMWHIGNEYFLGVKPFHITYPHLLST